MFRLVVLSCALAAVCAQRYVDPKLAKILKEQRFNTGDGRAGSSFATEDGKVFKEETAADGSRLGQYSYIGADGQTYTVRYSAGKDGFKILDGAHIPEGVTGHQSAPFGAQAPEQPAQRAQVPQFQPLTQAPRILPQAQPQPRPVPQVRQPVVDYDYVQEEEDPNRNPFVNPFDPTHSDFSFNENGANFDPRNPQKFGKNLVPDCANCEGFNPFVNPFDATHAQKSQLSDHFAGRNVPQQRRPALRVPPVQPRAPVPRPQVPQIPQRPVPVPKNVFPPGQLKLNRFETGFNFDFES